MTKRDVPRVLLIWPGGMFAEGGNYGVPQMLNIAQFVRKRTGASVEIRDLDQETEFGPVDVRELSRGFDVVGLSCYSSFDYLKSLALGRAIKEAHPKTWLVTGGYHPSARPQDFTLPESPFDYVIVGDGEVPMARLVQGLATGKRPLQRVLGPEALPSPNDVIPYDWSLLDRYKDTARKHASQFEIYLSRGCPYDCSFCMERAKRETSWRALSPLAAVEELRRVDRMMDLSSWTLRVVDPLFGMKRAWRREFLEELARAPIRARKIWLLIRLDLVEREDFELMARCNVAPGFGLESGDPDQLRRIRKTGMLSGYLDKMLQVAEWARQYHVPFGANIIAGHPGETEQSLRNSARYMEKLFLDPKGTLGFLSVDPFRLYPGSPIADDLEQWRADTGMRAHRYPWWTDGDQGFLSEWVDPSAELDYARRESLTHELFAPIVAGVRQNFAYQGPATDYFQRAVDEQVELFTERRRSQKLALQALWQRLLSAEDTVPRFFLGQTQDAAFRSSALGARAEQIQPWQLTDAERRALTDVPREDFLPVDELQHAGTGHGVALDPQRRVLSFRQALDALRALDVCSGGDFLEVGGGTGYCTALALAMSRTPATSTATDHASDAGHPQGVRPTAGCATFTLLERDAELAEQARRVLPKGVHVVSDASELLGRAFSRVLVHDTWFTNEVLEQLSTRIDGSRELGRPGESHVLGARLEESRVVHVAADGGVLSAERAQLETRKSKPVSMSSTDASNANATLHAAVHPLRVGWGPSWAAAVFHVLAHVELGALPSSSYSESYVKWAAHQLGPADERELGSDAQLLAQLIQSHEHAARLQSLAWLFRDAEQALACAERSLSELLPSDTTDPRWLNAARAMGAEAEMLRCAVLLELPHWQRLTRPQPETEELEQHLTELARTVPELREHRIEMLPALTVHGRVHAGQIWIGCPSAELGVSALQVAWQAAHEATVSMLGQQARGKYSERELERRAVATLKARTRVPVTRLTPGR